MEAKKKARELVHRFQKTLFFHVTDERIDIQEAKQCALIVVEEILLECHSDRDGFWYKVKQEIEKL